MNQAILDLLADLRVLVQTWTITGKKIGMAADQIALAGSAVASEIPPLADSVKEAADAMKTFKFSGPMGMHGGSS